MSKVAVVTDPEIVPGFELAGVDTYAAANAREAEDLLRNMISKNEYGMIVVAEDLMADLSTRNRQTFEAMTVPLVIAMPMPIAPTKEELGRKFVADMVRQSIGYQIRI